MKHYETTERTPALRLRSESFDDNPNTWLYLEERSNDEWVRIGSLELGYGPTNPRGILDDSPVEEWSFTRFHANGDRVAVSRRLTLDVETDKVTVTLEETRKEKLGFGRREEHTWEEQDSWEFEAPQLAANTGR